MRCCLKCPLNLLAQMSRNQMNQEFLFLSIKENKTGKSTFVIVTGICISTSFSKFLEIMLDFLQSKKLKTLIFGDFNIIILEQSSVKRRSCYYRNFQLYTFEQKEL